VTVAWSREDSNLYAHAVRELELAHVEEDVRPSLLDAVAAFASYGHSGGSAGVCVLILRDLLQYQPLSPLTDDPAEWMLVEEDKAGNKRTWQSIRASEAFSDDAGKTYYMLREERRWIPWSLRKKLRNDVSQWLVFPRHRSTRSSASSRPTTPVSVSSTPDT
jgi:hypothetical protein